MLCGESFVWRTARWSRTVNDGLAERPPTSTTGLCLRPHLTCRIQSWLTEPFAARKEHGVRCTEVLGPLVFATSSTWKAVQVIDEKQWGKGIGCSRTWHNLAKTEASWHYCLAFEILLAYYVLASQNPVWLILKRGPMAGPEIRGFRRFEKPMIRRLVRFARQNINLGNFIGLRLPQESSCKGCHGRSP
jgi:hypothetical protein